MWLSPQNWSFHIAKALVGAVPGSVYDGVADNTLAHDDLDLEFNASDQVELTHLWIQSINVDEPLVFQA
ncbi:hypothetical protein C8N36_101166 [Pelagimonas varians]|uniref:Uncharacterized protein n=1 Tax=Pelagimonas varians TaxID=696760 RepID=A0A238JTE5_9RHOB|nr:hypothetical protein C8N36_101166 [Pelagimonas varians]SMX33753.1 hypothetical protein PEV8663_00300 [Pelagimonas varians]